MSEREWLYGRNSVREALRAGRRPCYRLWLAEGIRPAALAEALRALAADRGCAVERVPRGHLDRAVGHRRHQGVALEVGPYPYVDPALPLERGGRAPFLLLLDLLQDPQNLGTLLRTAEAVGVHGVYLPRRRGARVTPAVVRASAGAVEHLAVAQVTNLARWIERLKERGIWVYGLERDPRAASLFETDLSGPIALVVGSEGEGLRPLVRRRCDGLLYLPMEGRVNSLNAAVAGSIALYHAWRCRQAEDAAPPP